MFSTDVIIIAAVALVVGIVIGALLARTLSPEEQKARSLENRLQDAEKNLTDYQQEVTKHFADTAQLVNNLTQSYKDVHQHLANDALKLANVDISRKLLSEPVDGNDTELLEEQHFTPPKDWAPKAPGSEGQLSETYGLNEEKESLETEALTAKKH